MDLVLRTPRELVKILSGRLKKERLTQSFTQAEVAARAGVGVNTLSNLESGRNTSFESVIRIAMVLGRINEFETLFMPKLNSLDDMLRYEEGMKRVRVRKKVPRV